jgi:hypothetical protein
MERRGGKADILIDAILRIQLRELKWLLTFADFEYAPEIFVRSGILSASLAILSCFSATKVSFQLQLAIGNHQL